MPYKAKEVLSGCSFFWGWFMKVSTENAGDKRKSCQAPLGCTRLCKFCWINYDKLLMNRWRISESWILCLITCHFQVDHEVWCRGSPGGGCSKLGFPNRKNSSWFQGMKMDTHTHSPNLLAKACTLSGSLWIARRMVWWIRVYLSRAPKNKHPTLQLLLSPPKQSYHFIFVNSLWWRSRPQTLSFTYINLTT